MSSKPLSARARTLTRHALELLLVYCVAVALAWAFQRRLLYPARGRVDAPPPPDAHLLTLTATDGVPVHALELASRTAARTIVYFHGNGEVVGDNVGFARELVSRGLSVVLVEYRGYGFSQPGTPTEAGLYADAEAVLASLTARGIGPSQVVLWGTSLGTGVAAEMATRGRGSALVLVSPYTSMTDVAAVHLPWLPVRLLLEDRYETLKKAPRLTLPTLVIHGTADEVVPYRMGEAVARRIAGAELVTVPGGHHNDLFLGGGARPYDAVHEFLRRTDADRAAPGGQVP